MEEKIEGNSKWQLLDGDKDVLLIGEESFTVSKLKELIKSEIGGKL